MKTSLSSSLSSSLVVPTTAVVFVRLLLWVVLLVTAAGGVSSTTTTTTTKTTTTTTTTTTAAGCSPADRLIHPVLCRMWERLATEPAQVAAEIQQHSRQHGLLVGEQQQDDWKTTTTTTANNNNNNPSTKSSTNNNQLPVVFAHGMGDSCFNRGMQRMTAHTSSLLDNVLVICLAIGANQQEDTNNGYFLNMNDSVDVFARAVRSHAELQAGFHAIGFSQGNNVIRGYLAHYNDPPVHTFLSVNGANAGVGAVPHCRPELYNNQDNNHLTGICDLLLEQASRRAYTTFAQQHSFQANYWRDPRPSEFHTYQRYSQLAVWNNEAGFVNQTLRDNWQKTQAFVWVLATEDEMIWPLEGEQWGAPDPRDPFHAVLPMNQTAWYQQDLFGLKTAQEAGKNYFESFVGDHLQFSLQDDFDRWVHTYLVGGGKTSKSQQQQE